MDKGMHMNRSLMFLGGALVLVFIGPPVYERVKSRGPSRSTAPDRAPAALPSTTELQHALRDAGFDVGAADGRMGPRTRSALKTFQASHRLRSSGTLDADTWRLLQQAAASAASHRQPETVSSAGDTTVESAAEAQAVVMTARLHAPERVRDFQLALKQAGFDPGPVDGKLGTRTRSALVAFQKANGLDADGVAGVKTWEVLRDYLAMAQGSD